MSENSLSDNRIGAAALMVGSVAVAGFGAAHGVLPEDSGSAVLAYVAEHPHYAGVHLGAMIGVLLWTVGIATVPGSLGRPLAASMARLGVISAVIGAAVFVVQFSIDGFGHHAMADRWLQAPPEEQAALARTVERLEVLLQGPAFAWTALLWGLPIALVGLAVVIDDRVASWLGWVGVLLGSASFAAAVLRFLQFAVLSDGFVFAATTLGAALWSFALGVVMWRRVRGSSTAVAPDAKPRFTRARTPRG